MFIAKYTASAAPSAFGSSPDRGAKALVMISLEWTPKQVETNSIHIASASYPPCPPFSERGGTANASTAKVTYFLVPNP